MTDGSNRILLYTWTGVLLLAAAGFAGWGIGLGSPAIYDELGSAGAFLRAINWVGFAIAVGFAGLPWVLEAGAEA